MIDTDFERQAQPVTPPEPRPAGWYAKICEEGRQDMTRRIVEANRLFLAQTLTRFADPGAADAIALAAVERVDFDALDWRERWTEITGSLLHKALFDSPTPDELLRYVETFQFTDPQ